MSRRQRLRLIVLAMVLGVLAAAGPPGVRPALALGVAIEVNTTADTEAADGYCSLREAIYASNGGGYFDCDGTTSADSIRFNIGTGIPVITLGSALPDITQQVTVRGNTGGATRVKLDGAGSGLAIRYTANNTYIGSMVMGGILVDGADNVTIVSNVLRSISGGANVSNLKIGGSNPGPGCSGECNLINGNTNGDGIYFGSAGGTIKGNFIGVDASGSAAAPNRTGILVTSGAFTIGGTTPEERNVVSGNTRFGMELHACTCLVQGNYIGTNAAGNAAVPNGYGGMKLDMSNATVGGSAPGAGNVISGNLGDGIYAEEQDQYSTTVIEGNRIGTKAKGGALGNSGSGIYFYALPTVRDASIGSATTPAAANIIAYNGGAGVRMSGSNARYNQVRGNSIHHNAGKGIALEGGANQSITPPAISSTSPVGGTACANCAVDIYSDSADEGQVFEATVNADGLGNWSFPGSVSGPNVTATNTQLDVYGNASTSEFSAAVALPAPKRPDGRIAKGSGAFVGNNIYNTTGVNQTRTGSGGAGTTITFKVSIQNDGSKDTFGVLGSGSGATGYTVRYFRGTTDITAAVVAGTYHTRVLRKGDKFLIKAKVKVTSSATKGSSVIRIVTITSLGDAGKQDAVKLVVSRK